MPKDRRMNLLSSDRDRVSPYACSSEDSNHGKSHKYLPQIGDEKEWEEARCPVCMDHPHNAVLLLCSSCEKGCRPYMCDTSDRHSNCLNQFFNSVGGALSTEVRDVTVARMQSSRETVEETLLRPIRPAGEQVIEIRCPLCRGQISGWVVIENVRCYMDSKVRNCSLESCNFSGDYMELSKHARSEHPNVKPSDADPERQAEWMRLEFQRDHRDALGLVEALFESDEYDYRPAHSGGDTPDAIIGRLSIIAVSDMSVDFDVGSNFPYHLSNEYTFDGPYGWSRAGARLSPWGSITLISGTYDGEEIPSPRRPVRLSSTGEVTYYTATSGSVDSGPENTSGDERTGDRSLDRRSTSGSRSRFQTQASPRMARETGSRRVRNTSSRRTGGRSFAERLVSRRSNSNQVARNNSHGRWNGHDASLFNY